MLDAVTLDYNKTIGNSLPPFSFKIYKLTHVSDY